MPRLIVISLHLSILGAPVRIAIAVIAISTSIGVACADTLDELKHERAQVEDAIKEAQKASDKYSGGLLGSLIASRLEILKTNDAILQQRIYATEAGAKVNVVVAATTPDPGRADALEKEMRTQEERVATQEAESAKYSGGLIKGIVESEIATSRLSIEMLRLEYVKAKYGIAWMPALSGTQPTDSKASVHESPANKADQPQDATGSIEPPRNPLVPILSNKQFYPRNIEARMFEDLLVFDVSWDTSKLKKPTRAIKGLLVFGDLFREAQFRLRVTLTEPLNPGSKFKQTGTGFKYNQFDDAHQWVHSTDLKDMTVWFEPSEILYADGSVEKY